MGLREGLSRNVECVSGTCINWLLEPGRENNLNESMYACPNLIELVYSASRLCLVSESPNEGNNPDEILKQVQSLP